MDWAYEQDVPKDAMAVLVALAHCHNGKTGHCFPSIERLVEMTKWSRATVVRSTAYLERAGLITKDHRGNGRGITTRYSFQKVLTQSTFTDEKVLTQTPFTEIKVLTQDIKVLTQARKVLRGTTGTGRTGRTGSKEKKRARGKSKPKLEIELPAWLPSDQWQHFVDHRKALKAPLTPRATTLAINTLDRFREQGHDPTTIIEQSILHGWKGLFAPKDDRHEAHQRIDNSAPARVKRAGERAIAEEDRRAAAAARTVDGETLGEDDGHLRPPLDLVARRN